MDFTQSGQAGTSGCSYIFLDESGNLDFGGKGSRHLILTAVSMRLPSALTDALDEYRYECLAAGMNREYFHCFEDVWAVRRHVFGLIARHAQQISVDCLVGIKETGSLSRREVGEVYSGMMESLLLSTLSAESGSGVERVAIVTDTIPVQSRQKRQDKGIKKPLIQLRALKDDYYIFHHQSRSHFGLQIADYCSWAIFRKHEMGDARFYEYLQAAIRSETVTTVGKDEEGINDPPDYSAFC